MNTRRNAYSHKRSPRERLCRMLRIVLAVCLLAGVFGQLTLLTKLSAQSKEISKVNKEIRDLTALEENLQVCLSMYQNLDRIEALAYGMGMQFPADEQIRVVSMPGNMEDASTQTAENTEVETLMETSMQ